MVYNTLCGVCAEGAGAIKDLCLLHERCSYRLSAGVLQLQVQFLNIIRDNARKGPVKVHLNKSLKCRPLLDIGKSALAKILK